MSMRELPDVLLPEQFRPFVLAAGALGRTPEIAARNRAVAAVLLYTGIKIAPFCALTLADLHLDDVDPATGKRVPAWLQLPDGRRSDLLQEPRQRLRAYLKVRRKPREGVGEPLFVSSYGLPLSLSPVQRMVQQAGQRLGLPFEVTPTVLRHSLGAYIHLHTDSYDLVMEQLGLKDPQTAALYARLARQIKARLARQGAKS